MTKNVSPKLTKNVKSDQKRQFYVAPALLKNREKKIKIIKIYLKNNKIIKNLKKMQRLVKFWHAVCWKKDKPKGKVKRPRVKYITGLTIFWQMPKNILFFT